MEQFTIYCTPEQTKKALELGAPIETYKPIIIDSRAGGSFTTPTMETVTAEQMIGYLATKGIFVGVAWDYINMKWESYTHVERKMIGCDGYYCREEATLAAINEALEYLSKNNLIK